MAELILPDDIDFSLYEEETDPAQKVRDASVYVQQLLDRMASPVREKHSLMPWGKTHRLIQFRPGEVTLWGGQSGAGKSLVTGQVGLSLCAQDMKVCVASFEMKPHKTMERMGQQFTGFDINDEQILSDPTERREVAALYAEFRDWTSKRLWLYDQQGSVQWRRMCAVARYCAKELGIAHLFIDNLMKCVAGEDDYNGQKAFVDELCAIARDHKTHIHLIHHVKKPATDDHKASKYDFKGSGAITDQVDNVIAVWRNKKKERDLAAKKLVQETDPDVMLIVDKQRNGSGWEGNIGLWFRQRSRQLVGSYNAPQMKFYGPPDREDGAA